MRVSVGNAISLGSETFANLSQSAVDLATHPPTRNGMYTAALFPSITSQTRVKYAKADMG